MIKRIAELIVGNVGPYTCTNKADTGEQIITFAVSATNPLLIPLLPIAWLASIWSYKNQLKYVKPEGAELYSLFGNREFWLYWRRFPKLEFNECRPAILRRSEKEMDDGALHGEGTEIVFKATPRTWVIYGRLLISQIKPPIDQMIQEKVNEEFGKIYGGDL